MNVINLSILSQHNEALSMEVCKLKVWLDVEMAWNHVEQAECKVADVMLQAAGAHAMICNLEKQELHCQLAEKTRTHKKCKINMEGHIITPLDSVVLFAQQDAEHWKKEVDEEAKQKSKTDAILSREHQCVLTAGTKVFANPLTSYNHMDDLLDIVTALGLEHTGTIAVLTEHIQVYLASHPDIASNPHFSGLMKAHKLCKCMHTDVDVPSQDQPGPSGSN